MCPGHTVREDMPWFSECLRAHSLYWPETHENKIRRWDSNATWGLVGDGVVRGLSRRWDSERQSPDQCRRMRRAFLAGEQCGQKHEVQHGKTLRKSLHK